MYSEDEIGRVAQALNAMIDSISSGERRMSAILETAKDAIITINERGIIKSCNNMGCLVFGYELNELVGKNISMLMPSPYREAHDGYLHNYVSTGHAKIIGLGREVEGLRKNGQVFPIELAVTEVKMSGERLFTGFVRDISDRKEAEARMNLYMNELEISRLQADSANKMKSEFLATMSHEIRTPMNGIIGMAELMGETTLTNRQQGYLRTIMGSAESLLTIINDILDFSKIEADKVDLESIPVDLMTLIEEILEQIGYAVIPAENADTALRKLKWQGPNIDLVLLDYEMPDMTGIDTVREIRRGEKSGAWAHVPVIGFSSNNDPKKRERCLAAGMDDYLSKDTFLPRWRGSLEGVIKKWIGSSDFFQKETEERKEEEGKKE